MIFWCEADGCDVPQGGVLQEAAPEAGEKDAGRQGTGSEREGRKEGSQAGTLNGAKRAAC